MIALQQQVREKAALITYFRARRTAEIPSALPPPIPNADTDARLAEYIAWQHTNGLLRGTILAELTEEDLTSVMRALEEIASRLQAEAAY